MYTCTKTDKEVWNETQAESFGWEELGLRPTRMESKIDVTCPAGDQVRC